MYYQKIRRKSYFISYFPETDCKRIILVIFIVCLQVREQAKLEAQRVRKAVVQEKVQIEDGLKQELKEKYLEDKNATEKKLQEEYLMCLQAFGEAHRGAKNQVNPYYVVKNFL